MSAATFTIAEDVRKMYEKIIPIINIDTRQVVGGVGVILLRIIDIIKENKDTDEIICIFRCKLTHRTDHPDPPFRAC